MLPRLLMRINRILFACEIPPSAELEDGCSLVHNGLGVVIHGKAVVGAGTKIFQNVTIGGRGGRGSPIVGHNVSLGCGSCILGGIHIGDGAKIGANAVVVKDVPAGATAVGVPAKILEKSTAPAEETTDETTD